jgi:hypothetical protein
MLRKEGRNDFLALGVYRSSKFCEKSSGLHKKPEFSNSVVDVLGTVHTGLVGAPFRVWVKSVSEAVRRNEFQA